MDTGVIQADTLPVHYPVATAADLAFYEECNSHARKTWLNSFLNPEGGLTHGHLCSFRQQLISPNPFRIPDFLADRKTKYPNLDKELLGFDALESGDPQNWRRCNETQQLIHQQLRLWEPQIPTTNDATAIPPAVIWKDLPITRDAGHPEPDALTGAILDHCGACVDFLLPYHPPEGPALYNQGGWSLLAIAIIYSTPYIAGQLTDRLTAQAVFKVKRYVITPARLLVGEGPHHLELARHYQLEQVLGDLIFRITRTPPNVNVAERIHAAEWMSVNRSIDLCTFVSGPTAATAARTGRNLTITGTSPQGRTAWHHAVRNPHRNFWEWIDRSQTTITRVDRDGNGNTALIDAVHAGRTRFIKYLSQQRPPRGAKIIDANGLDALDHALRSDREENGMMAGYVFEAWTRDEKLIPALMADLLPRLRQLLNNHRTVVDAYRTATLAAGGTIADCDRQRVQQIRHRSRAVRGLYTHMTEEQLRAWGRDPGYENVKALARNVGGRVVEQIVSRENYGAGPNILYRRSRRNIDRDINAVVHGW